MRITQGAIGVVIEFVITAATTNAAYNDESQQDGGPITNRHGRISGEQNRKGECQ
jgi:hypothetical protein